MCKILAVRLASAMGLFSLLLFTAALIAFSSLPTTGAGLTATRGQIAVNRTRKGDRLPTARPADGRDERESSRSPAHTPSQGGIPTGCDPAFSPISSPRLAHVFRRCVV